MNFVDVWLHQIISVDEEEQTIDRIIKKQKIRDGAKLTKTVNFVYRNISRAFCIGYLLENKKKKLW